MINTNDVSSKKIYSAVSEKNKLMDELIHLKQELLQYTKFISDKERTITDLKRQIDKKQSEIEELKMNVSDLKVKIQKIKRFGNLRFVKKNKELNRIINVLNKIKFVLKNPL